jgi:hypothetical protein
MAIFMLLPLLCQVLNEGRGHCGRDRMVVWFTTTFAISAYHYWRCEFEPRSWRGALYTTLCDKVCQWFATGLWFSPGTSFSSTNKTDHIVESGIEHHKPTIACYDNPFFRICVLEMTLFMLLPLLCQVPNEGQSQI